MIDASKIGKIENLLKEQSRIDKELRKLSGEMDYDKSRLNDIFSDAMEIGKKSGWSVMQTRQYYLFVVLFIYDPHALVKKLRRNGLREIVSDIMGLTSNNVSHITKCLLFHFRLYADFRESVNNFYDFVIGKYDCRS